MRRPLVAYPLAITALGAAVALRWLLDPLMGDALPLVTLFGAVAAAVWLGGYPPAIVVGVLGYAACDYLFIPPRGVLALQGVGHAVGLIAYVFTCSLIIGFGEALRAAQVRATEQRQLLRVTLGSIGDAVISTDNEGRVTYLNAVAESLTGWTQRDALGRPLDEVFRILNEETREPVENPAVRALREGTVVGLANHTVLVRADGHEIAIDDSAAPIQDESGGVSGSVLIFRDVTAQRHLAQEKASQLLGARLLASIVETSDDGIVSKSLDGVIQSWNGGAERLFGYSAEQAVGRHISLVIPPDRAAEEDRFIASLKAGRRIEHFETERVRSDGRRILVSLSLSPVKDEAGNVVGASKIVRDVTQQRRAEERGHQLLAEAAAANAKFRAFFDQGALFAAIVDLDGGVLEPNRPSWEGCGYAREHVIGRPFWDGPWWSSSAALVERVEAACAEARAGDTFRDEVPYFVAGGSERAADLTILPIRDGAGRVLFLAATWIDITERKRLEDNLRSLAADLSEADRRKDVFLAMLAHELRNPLAPLSNAVQVLRLAGADGNAVRSASGMVERQVRHMARLVDDLLDMSRITQGKIELRKERMELAPVLNQAVEAARDLCRGRDQELTVTVPGQAVHVDADPTRLAQVVGNLLNNASKFTDRGGHIQLALEREGDQAAIRVRDTGIGIAAEHLPRVFEMFTQVDTSLERSRDGLGIGLTLVKTLVEMHDGTVAVQSEGPGRGSEFVVRLPVLPEAAEPRPTAPDGTPAPASRRRILIVDDNEDGAESLAMLLKLGGHETHTARDGLEALSAAERLRPDVVLLDIGLPRLNGYEACRRIRQQPWGRDMVLVAVTGWGQQEDQRRSREAGFSAHLVKPLDMDVLKKLLDPLPSG
jgi:PAS domain S-box-containing protein